jgi:hypothetical protein
MTIITYPRNTRVYCWSLTYWTVTLYRDKNSSVSPFHLLTCTYKPLTPETLLFLLTRYLPHCKPETHEPCNTFCRSAPALLRLLFRSHHSALFRVEVTADGELVWSCKRTWINNASICRRKPAITHSPHMFLFSLQLYTACTFYFFSHAQA